MIHFWAVRSHPVLTSNRYLIGTKSTTVKIIYEIKDEDCDDGDSMTNKFLGLRSCCVYLVPQELQRQ